MVQTNNHRFNFLIACETINNSAIFLFDLFEIKFPIGTPQCLNSLIAMSEVTAKRASMCFSLSVMDLPANLLNADL